MPDYGSTGFNAASAALSDDVHFYTDPYMANTNGNHNAPRTLPSLATTSSSLPNGPSHAGAGQTAAPNDKRAKQFPERYVQATGGPTSWFGGLTEEFLADDPKQTIFTVSGRKKDCNIDGAAATMANV
ncbi:hypothetical protein LTR49_027547 [Elasticomyces elasticus]|nr:hypothetical protein LTR49_027547 [Elasticomyces elasticus]